MTDGLDVMHGATVVPIRQRYEREADTGEGQRIVAYRITCRCGWRTTARPTVRAARADYAEHVVYDHEGAA